MEMFAIERIAAAVEPAVLALNNSHGAEVGTISAARLRDLLGKAFCARCINRGDAFLIAFDETADYDSLNFLWFRERFVRFVYIDRIVVAPQSRGRGLARSLYRDLYAFARAAGHDMIACEVNIEPPNPVSDAFHAREGFEEIGRMLNPQSRKTVRYLTRAIIEGTL